MFGPQKCELDKSNSNHLYNSISVFDGQYRKNILKKQQNRRPDFTFIIELYEVQEQKSQFIRIQVLSMLNSPQTGKKGTFRLYSKKISNETLRAINQPTNYLKSLEHLYLLMSNEQNYIFNQKQKQVVLTLKTNQFCKKTNQLLFKKIQIPIQLDEVQINVQTHFMITHAISGKQQKISQSPEKNTSKIIEEQHKLQGEEQTFKVLLQKQQLKTVYEQEIKQIKQDVSQLLSNFQLSFKSIAEEIKQQKQILKKTQTMINDKFSNFQSYFQQFTKFFKTKLQQFQQYKHSNLNDPNQKISQIDQQVVCERIMQNNEYETFSKRKVSQFYNMHKIHLQHQLHSLQQEQNNEKENNQDNRISQEQFDSINSCISSSQSYNPSQSEIKLAQKLEKVQSKKESMYQKEDSLELVKKKKKIIKKNNKYQNQQNKNNQLKKTKQQINVKLPKVFPKLIHDSEISLNQQEQDNLIQFQTQNFIRKGEVITFKGNQGKEKRFFVNNLTEEQYGIANQFKVQKSVSMNFKFGLSFETSIKQIINTLSFIYDAKSGIITEIDKFNTSKNLKISSLKTDDKIIFLLRKKEEQVEINIQNNGGNVIERIIFQCCQLKKCKNLGFFIQFKHKGDSIRIKQLPLIQKDN